MKKKTYGKEDIYNGHPNTIPSIVKQNTKCLQDSFGARSQQEVENNIESRKAIYKLFRSFIISKDFFDSKSFITIEDFLTFLIELPIEKKLYQYVTTYRHLNNNQSILNFKFQERIILA
ncbi:MAG: hypothetical protein RR523_13270 [Cetobacterium sp.]|uniref:hypothetical protein n=1 Tax=Cetobacterium sp. TaxID=2071632 RepID=UPI002FCA6945